jgi:uncharacterized protein (TIGR02594 family)
MLGIDFAKKYLKYHEVKDRTKLTEILKKYSIKGDLNIDPSTTPWCAAFVNAMERAVGNPGNGKLNARSFLTYGHPIEGLKFARRGDILVFSRGGSTWQGHVTYLDAIEPNGLLRCLGGNQSDSVSVGWYPKSRLIGIRRF